MELDRGDPRRLARLADLLTVEFDDGRPRVRMLNLTRLWLFSRHMYRIGDMALWVPISHRMLGYIIVVFVPALIVFNRLGIPFSGPGLTVNFVLPGVLVWWALRKVGEGEKPVDLVGSWVRLLVHAARAPRPVPAVCVSGGARSPLAASPVRVGGRTFSSGVL